MSYNLDDSGFLLDSDFGQDEIKYVDASKGKRFANFIIDRIFFYLGTVTFFMILMLSGSDIGWTQEINQVVDIIVSAFVYAIMMAFAETAMGGKTIGKYITGTRVLLENGERPDFNAILSRSFSRIVPFEPFSFLGDDDRGWHDKWSGTMVIDEKKSTY